MDILPAPAPPGKPSPLCDELIGLLNDPSTELDIEVFTAIVDATRRPVPAEAAGPLLSALVNCLTRQVTAEDPDTEDADFFEGDDSWEEDDDAEPETDGTEDDYYHWRDRNPGSERLYHSFKAKIAQRQAAVVGGIVFNRQLILSKEGNRHA